jgi:hypothetical protein
MSIDEKDAQDMREKQGVRSGVTKRGVTDASHVVRNTVTRQDVCFKFKFGPLANSALKIRFHGKMPTM